MNAKIIFRNNSTVAIRFENDKQMYKQVRETFDMDPNARIIISDDNGVILKDLEEYENPDGSRFINNNPHRYDIY